MQIKRKLTTAIATGAVLLNALAPITLATTTIEISGNGTQSDNDAGVSVSQTTTVVQSNDADIYNYVDASADTGDNDANDNTGGDVSIETGDAETDVTVSNTANKNVASVDCCDSRDTDVLISGNGSNSDNTVGLKSESSNVVFQENEADIYNKVYADSDTGGNDAEDNTGGDVKVETGDATTKVSLSTTANANSAQIGGNGQDGGSVSLRILGNGTHSDNDILLGLASETIVSQSNEADVDNYVDADADTGDNDANDNTGGDVSIETGDADVDVNVDTMVNFNWAASDCGCLLDDVLVKIAGNGSDSDNSIEAELGDSLEVFQENCGDEQEWDWWWDWHRDDCSVDNTIHADADTGYNDADDNTGDVHGGDPSVETGDADTEVDVNNSGNVNVFGEAPEWDLPDFDFDFDFTFDFDDFWEWFISQA